MQLLGGQTMGNNAPNIQEVAIRILNQTCTFERDRSISSIKQGMYERERERDQKQPLHSVLRGYKSSRNQEKVGPIMTFIELTMKQIIDYG